MRVLEPSAGTGSLIACIPEDCIIVAIEINYALVTLLRAQGRAAAIQADFLGVKPDAIGGFDRIVMNPPFDHGSDIKHIEHAQTFLEPGGRLVAICSDGPRQRAAFADAEFYEPLPAGTFAESGTGVNTAIVILGGIA
jgi:16S rRNA G1207 methylase RsmC